MEISIVSKNCLKIKGKKASLIIDPTKNLSAKIASDAIVVFNKLGEYDDGKIEGHRVVILGPGEYEVGGIKISGSKTDESMMYQLFVDGVDVMLAHADGIEKSKEKLSSHHALLLFGNSKIDLSVVATLEPRVVVLYGDAAQEVAQMENVVKMAKFSTSAEKLPEKMEVIVLQ